MRFGSAGGSSWTGIFAMSSLRRENPDLSTSKINAPPGKDAVIEKAYHEIQKHVMINQPKADQLYREMFPHVVEQAYVIPLASPYSYTLWQPWIKNHHGATNLWYLRWYNYTWIDQDLKEKMTGRK